VGVSEIACAVLLPTAPSALLRLSDALHEHKRRASVLLDNVLL
jgi:hypothetical protein